MVGSPLGRQGGVPEEKWNRGGVGEAQVVVGTRHALGARGEHGAAVDGVKGVGPVDLQAGPLFAFGKGVGTTL